MNTMAARAKVWVWLVLCLLAVSSVAAIEDFTASGTGRVLSFECSPAEGNITITNTGDVASGYDLAAEGTAKNWVQFLPDSFALNPGQSQIVQEFFTIPCDAKDASLDVSIQTEELELFLSQDIIVQTPNNIVLVPETFAQEILPCDPADFSFVLHNPAEFDDIYHLKVTDSPDQTALSDTALTLLPHTNETVAITVRPKDCTLAGDFNPILTVETEKTKLRSEIGMFLHINNSDIVTIAQGVDKIRAGFAAQEASIELFNEGNRKTTYDLRVEGADWVTIQPDQVTISPHDSKDVKLVMQPVEGTLAGTYIVTLNARVSETGKEYSKQLTVKLGPPTLAERLFTDLLPVTIGGAVLLILLIWLVVWGVKKYHSPEYQQKLAERRVDHERRKLERIALKEAKRQEREESEERKAEEQRLAEEEEARAAEKHERELERERLKAQRDYDKQLRQEHLIIPKDSIIEGIKTTGKRFWKIALLLLILVFIAVILSYQTVVAQHADALLSGIIVLAVILCLYRMRRRRMARGRWKLVVANKMLTLDTKWKKGITQLSFKLNSVVKKLVVTVRRCKPTIAPAAEGVYQSFVITDNTDGDIVSASRMTFRVKKSWMMRKRISPDAVRLMKLENDRWESIVAEPVSTDNKYVYFSADADSFGEFAIVGKPAKKPQAARRKKLFNARWIGKAAFGVFVAVAILALFMLTPPPQNTVGIPAQVWKQDAQQTVDLAKYFHDPDMDSLAFSANPTQNIDITFIGAKVLLVPHYGWSGTERTVFMASDGKGGLVRSNSVDLVVQPAVIPVTWKRYASTIFTVAAIIAVILALILFRNKLMRIVGLKD